jgi:hypothetical protein
VYYIEDFDQKVPILMKIYVLFREKAYTEEKARDDARHARRAEREKEWKEKRVQRAEARLEKSLVS